MVMMQSIIAVRALIPCSHTRTLIEAFQEQKKRVACKYEMVPCATTNYYNARALFHCHGVVKIVL